MNEIDTEPDPIGWLDSHLGHPIALGPNPDTRCQSSIESSRLTSKYLIRGSGSDLRGKILIIVVVVHADSNTS